MDTKEAKLILERYRKGESSATELQLVEQWYQQLEDTSDWHWKDGEKEVIGQLIEEQLLEKIRADRNEKDGGAKVRRMIKRIAVAASIIVAVGLGSYFLFFNSVSKQTEIVQTQQERFKNDVVPASEQTMLVLADGKQIILDSVSGAISNQGATTVINLQGQLRYQPAADQGKEVVYNTIHTGKGNRYNLILPDGSKVWLNAASSLRFPTAFPGSNRIVELIGEGYFEITHDANKPFHVRYANTDVEVLGTHFNINSYTDEPAIRTTLLEGSVKITSAGLPVVLKPGEQLSVTQAGGEAKLLKAVNVDEIIAWKENRFEFNDASIETIMRELSRWYDITVSYKGKVNQGFNGRISRNEPISKVLQLLELTDQVHFTIEGKAVTVMK